MRSRPYSARWTLHALEKAEQLGYTRELVERTVFERHGQRVKNAGAAGWRVTSGNLVVVYEHPDDGNASRARIVTLWRRR